MSPLSVSEMCREAPSIIEIVDRQTPDESNRVSLERLTALGWTVTARIIDEAKGRTGRVARRTGAHGPRSGGKICGTE